MIGLYSVLGTLYSVLILCEPIEPSFNQSWKVYPIKSQIITLTNPKFHFADKIVRFKCLSILGMSVDFSLICF